MSWIGAMSRSRPICSSSSPTTRSAFPSSAPSRPHPRFVQGLRRLELYKLPGIAETIEWTRALIALDATSLEPQTIEATLGLLLKYQDDLTRVRGPEVARLLAAAGQALASDAAS